MRIGEQATTNWCLVAPKVSISCLAIAKARFKLRGNNTCPPAYEFEMASLSRISPTPAAVHSRNEQDTYQDPHKYPGSCLFTSFIFISFPQTFPDLTFPDLPEDQLSNTTSSRYRTNIPVVNIIQPDIMPSKRTSETAAEKALNKVSKKASEEDSEEGQKKKMEKWTPDADLDFLLSIIVSQYRKNGIKISNYAQIHETMKTLGHSFTISALQ